MKKSAPLAPEIKAQLATRRDSTLATLFSGQGSKNIFVTSADDRGVMRNGGRKGARFAPASLLKSFSSMQYHPTTLLGPMGEVSLSLGDDFERDQRTWGESWQQLWTRYFKEEQHALVHLGGGHDHIYPLLIGFERALQKIGDQRPICVLNLDAHLDTRADPLGHSGTPFRQAALELERELHMIQWGIHLSANSVATCEALPAPHRTTLILRDELDDETHALQRVLELAGDSHLIISLDADAIDGAQMKAVSAVNGRGLASEGLFKLVAGLAPRAAALGIYEYNPLFDDLSNYGSRLLAKLALTYLEGRAKK